MRFKGIDHASVRVADLDRARGFYTDILGLEPHPEKTNWLGFGQGCPIHLMERTLSGDDVNDPARHVALEVERLEDVVALLLDNGCSPFQADMDQREHRLITSTNGPLDFGIGTVFAHDPDGNIIEFIQTGRGIFAEHDADGAG
jgi:catechol 2,3-dioxygenase-like lactoylglutathione lyase family enzyme